MRSNTIDAITIIASCITIGLFFEFVYLTNEHKSSLRKLITREAHVQKCFEDTFLDYIRAANVAIFGRFFTDRFLSIRYFANCATLSLLALVVVFISQIFFFGSGELGTIKFGTDQISVFAVCIATNVIIDWLSIGQTHVFFAIASEQDKAWRVILLIFSDIYVTSTVRLT